jgi:hypothetical protein
VIEVRGFAGSLPLHPEPALLPQFVRLNIIFYHNLLSGFMCEGRDCVYIRAFFNSVTNLARLVHAQIRSVVAFSDLRKDGGRTYLLNTTFDLKPTKDGKLTGQLQIGKEFVDRAMIRILTQTFDGQPQTAGARYYQIPLKKFMKKVSAPASFQTPASIASPPASTATK